METQSRGVATSIKRKIYLGKCDGYGDGRKNCEAYVEFSLNDGRFSASGEIWKPSKRDIISGGQNLDELIKSFPKDKDLKKIHRIWKDYHLNDMRPGCEHQRANKWHERPIDPSKPLDAYGRFFKGQQQDSWNMLAWILPTEHPQGLLTKPCETCGYKYGTQWLKEEIPSDVIEEIISIGNEAAS
jgi:hypothetical protein